MNREQLEALFDGEDLGEFAIIRGLARRGRAHRAALELAADLLQEGLPGERFAVPEDEPARLAAAGVGAPFPARYEGEGYRVALWRGAGAVPRALLEAGPQTVELVIGADSVRLVLGVEVEIRWLDSPPASVALIPERALPLVLPRSPKP